MAIIFRCDRCDTRYRVDIAKAGCRARCRQCGGDIFVPEPTQRDQVADGPPLKRQPPSSPLPSINPQKRRQIADHIEEQIGPIDFIFHELVSEYVQIDVHRIPPQKNRPYFTLVTSGMSELPMTVPDGAESLRFAELMLCLPPSWRLNMEDFQDERNYWPIRLLKALARLPHEFRTWLGQSHSIPNGVPPLPYASNTRFMGAVIMPPLTTPDEFRALKLDQDEVIRFYSAVPLFQEEIDCKLQEGMNVLIDRLDRCQVTELIDLRRKNSCRKSWFGR